MIGLAGYKLNYNLFLFSSFIVAGVLFLFLGSQNVLAEQCCSATTCPQCPAGDTTCSVRCTGPSSTCGVNGSPPDGTCDFTIANSSTCTNNNWSAWGACDSNYCQSRYCDSVQPFYQVRSCGGGSCGSTTGGGGGGGGYTMPTCPAGTTIQCGTPETRLCLHQNNCGNDYFPSVFHTELPDCDDGSGERNMSWCTTNCNCVTPSPTSPPGATSALTPSGALACRNYSPAPVQFKWTAATGANFYYLRIDDKSNGYVSCPGPSNPGDY